MVLWSSVSDDAAAELAVALRNSNTELVAALSPAGAALMDRSFKVACVLFLVFRLWLPDA